MANRPKSDVKDCSSAENTAIKTKDIFEILVSQGMDPVEALRIYGEFSSVELTEKMNEIINNFRDDMLVATALLYRSEENEIGDLNTEIAAIRKQAKDERKSIKEVVVGRGVLSAEQWDDIAAKMPNIVEANKKITEAHLDSNRLMDAMLRKGMNVDFDKLLELVKIAMNNGISLRNLVVNSGFLTETKWEELMGKKDLAN